ncbi:MAG: rod shape-determining protein MreC [Candidatus Aminicenantes bacterium]|jgi:rod shape-determining protein MreC
MSSFFKRNKSLIVLAILIFLQLVLISIQVPQGAQENYFEKAVFVLFSPVQHGIVSFFQSIGGFLKGYISLRDAHVENEELRQEIFSLSQKNRILRNALEHYKNENEIEALLGEMYPNILHARVIGIDASNTFKSVMINRGALDGIEKNMVVLDKYGNLVGRVIGPIAFKEARVQLITDNDCGVSVFTEKDKVLGILSGDGKGSCVLEHIVSTDENVTEGENLYTTGFDSIFPPGINVGRITSITPTSDLFKEILVRPYFEFRHLDQLAVIRLHAKDIF